MKSAPGAIERVSMLTPVSERSGGPEKAAPVARIISAGLNRHRLVGIGVAIGRLSTLRQGGEREEEVKLLRSMEWEKKKLSRNKNP
jgi:hypothetical protein